jgi:outer membrane protein OmpA-like peptidoglycan-associated protein
MKLRFINAYLLGLLGGLCCACNNDRQNTQNSNSAPSATTTAATPVASEPTTTAKIPTDSATRPTQTDESGQNYTFSGNTDQLQIKGSENQYDILLPTDVLFDFDKSTIRPEGLLLLEKVKQHFVTHGVDQLHVWGHTDSKGNDQYNFRLSQRRAISVANWLKDNVKTRGLIMALGRGEQEPLVPNENPDGTDNPVNRQKNRRVTLSVVKYPDANKMLDEAKKASR